MFLGWNRSTETVFILQEGNNEQLIDSFGNEIAVPREAAKEIISIFNQFKELRASLIVTLNFRNNVLRKMIPYHGTRCAVSVTKFQHIIKGKKRLLCSYSILRRLFYLLCEIIYVALDKLKYLQILGSLKAKWQAYIFQEHRVSRYYVMFTQA